MKSNLQYKSDSIFIKSFSKENLEDLRELRNRDENRVRFVFSDVITIEQQEKWYESYMTKKNDYMFSVFLNSTNVWIGAVAIYDVNLNNYTAEFGRIVLDKNKLHGKKGAGVEATKAACTFAFQELGMKTIKLEVFKDNIPAIKTYERAGFKLTGETTTDSGQEMYLMNLIK